MRSWSEEMMKIVEQEITNKSWENLYESYGDKFDLDVFDHVTTVAVNEEKLISGCFALGRNWVETKGRSDNEHKSTPLGFKMFDFNDDSNSKEGTDGFSDLRYFYYGYDCVHKEDVETIKELYSNDNVKWYLRRNNESDFVADITKGAVTTLNYLVTIKDPVKRSAVWMYAFLRDVTAKLPYDWRGRGVTLAEAIKSAAYEYISNDCYWRLGLRRLVVVPLSFYWDTSVESVEEIFELAVKALEYVKENFEIIRYVTLDENGSVILPDGMEV